MVCLYTEADWRKEGEKEEGRRQQAMPSGLHVHCVGMLNVNWKALHWWEKEKRRGEMELTLQTD